jgi:hypothetical protein
MCEDIKNMVILIPTSSTIDTRVWDHSKSDKLDFKDAKLAD